LVHYQNQKLAMNIANTDWDVWDVHAPSMAQNYCPYELVFGKVNNLPKQFNGIENIELIYNIDDYAMESKYRLEVAFKRARKMVEEK